VMAIKGMGGTRPEFKHRKAKCRAEVVCG
jgi:hypothetical protein